MLNGKWGKPSSIRPDGVRWARLFDQAWCNWIDLEYNWPHFELVDPKLIWNGTSIAIWVRWTWIYLGCPDAKCGPLISMLACKIIKQLSLLIIGGLAAFRQSIQVHTNSLSFPPPNHNLNSTKMAKHEVIKLPFTSPPPSMINLTLSLAFLFWSNKVATGTWRECITYFSNHFQYEWKLFVYCSGEMKDGIILTTPPLRYLYLKNSTSFAPIKHDQRHTYLFLGRTVVRW